MKIKRISIYKEFQCTGAACQVNCCKGWIVPLDRAICKKYLAEKEKLDLRFRFFVKAYDPVPAFRSVFGRCPFWGRDHLCSIQKQYGEPYMARVCREFPRQIYHLGDFCEETLYLACPEAARLFLTYAEQGKSFHFEETEEAFIYDVNTTNDDKEFLSYLLTAREQLCVLLKSGFKYDSMVFLEYGRDAQNACLSGKACPEPLSYKGAGNVRLQMDCSVLNQLFFHGFYHPYLWSHLPFLHQLCVKYIVELGIPCRINREAANRKLAVLLESLESKMPELENILNCYYAYYLQSKFLDIYEDYSFLRCLAFGMAKIKMLQVLIALYAQGREHISEDEIAKIIAVYERRAPQIKKALGNMLWDVMKEN